MGRKVHRQLRPKGYLQVRLLTRRCLDQRLEEVGGSWEEARLELE
jgi:hypothetical protein